MTDKKNILKAHKEHPRLFQENSLIYPVLSRRAGGISIGVNLSPHKGCNFDCPYCQVIRNKEEKKAPPFSLSAMENELHHMIKLVNSGDLFKQPPFATTPPPLQRLNDIALSGDGEPTAESCFYDVCESVTAIKTCYKMDDVKVVVISNATMFHKENVQAGLSILDHHNGQVWAKLDAGTEAYYQYINISKVTLTKIIDNIILCGQSRKILIQTLFTRNDGVRVPQKEVEAYAHQLKEIVAGGCQIEQVQIHTIARTPANPMVSSLNMEELSQIQNEVLAVVDIPLQTFGGNAD
jgi:wyosine [tRNA(Phe)-imidazoG37] synthetase (radical SAM superfamily)